MTRLWKIIFIPMLALIAACSGNDKNVKHAEETLWILETQEEDLPLAPFVLGPGDQVSMNVWRHEDLSRSLQLDPTGRVSAPLAGEIMASGLTVPELRKEITARLSRYIINPQVDISLLHVGSRRVHVLGEVTTPGTLALDRRMVALEAIAMAGGFTYDANQDNVLLIRSRDGQARIAALRLKMDEVDEEQRGGWNVFLQGDDVIYVPPSKIASVERFMSRLNTIISPYINVMRGIVLTRDAYNAIIGEESISGGGAVIPP